MKEVRERESPTAAEFLVKMFEEATHKEEEWEGGRWQEKGVGDEENRIKEAFVIKDGDKNCSLSCFPPAVASDSFSKVASNLDTERSYLVTTRWS